MGNSGKGQQPMPHHVCGVRCSNNGEARVDAVIVREGLHAGAACIDEERRVLQRLQ